MPQKNQAAAVMSAKREMKRNFILPVPKIVNARLWIVGHPVEPIVLKDGNLLQLPAAELASSCLAGEIPFAAGFSVNQNQRGGVWFDEKLQLAPINRSLVSAHRSLVVSNHDE